MASAMPRDRLILLVGLITYGMGQSLLFVIFAPIARQLGIEEWQLGFIIAASNVMLAFSAPRWGRASQRLGRRTVYLIGLAGYAVGYALLAFGVQLGLLDVITGGALFALLLVLRLAYGVVVGGINPAATAYIADTTDEKSRGAGMALVAMSGGLGTIIGPAFAGALLVISPLFPMYAAAALAAAAGIWAYLALPEPARRANVGEDLKLKITDPRIVPYLVGWVVVFGTFTGVQTITAGLHCRSLRRHGHHGRPADHDDRHALHGLRHGVRPGRGAAALEGVPGDDAEDGLRRDDRRPAAAGIRSRAGIALPGLRPVRPQLRLHGSRPECRRQPERGAGRAGRRGRTAVGAPTVGMIFGPILCGLVYTVAPVMPMLGGAVLTTLVGIWFLFVNVPDPRATAPA